MPKLVLPLRAPCLRVRPESVLSAELTLADEADGERPYDTRIRGGLVIGIHVRFVAGADAE